MDPDRLPEAFVARMRELLGPEAAAFLDSYRRPAQRAVRANPLKLDPADLPDLLGIDPDPVPWCPGAFFLPEEARVGGTLAHAAGLCYVQEPSAMAVGEALDARPGQRVLDLAAAPGGKATQLAARLGGDGVVVANEVQRGRLRALADNLDRWGSWRTVLAAETVARLADRLPGAFDRVLLDAPCSGEGLFRRNPAAAAQWRPGHVRGSAERQRGLLADAARLVRPGGVLVYSTCTFAPEENEGQVAWFLTTHPDWDVLDLPTHPAFSPGRPDWTPSGPPALARTVRLWPHHLRGEGHFIAKLGRPPRALGGRAAENPSPRYRGPRRGSVAEPDAGGSGLSTGPGRAVFEAWRGFAAEALVEEPVGVTGGGGTGLQRGGGGGGRGGGAAGSAGVVAGAGAAGEVRAGACAGHGCRARTHAAGEGAGRRRGGGLGAGWDPGARRAGRVDPGEVERLAAGVGRAAGGTLKNHYPKGLRTM